MSATEPLTGTRIPTQSDGPLGGLQIANAVNDLADNTIPYFANASARDAAFASWVAAGHTMRNGLHCHVAGVGDQVYLSGGWRTITFEQSAKVSFTASGATSVSGTVTYPFAFTANPIVSLTVQVDPATGLGLFVGLTTTPSTTGFSWRVWERTGGAIASDGVVHWTARA